MLDILQTGKFGVLTNQKFLGTTSNNISNVNTVGYTRQETLVYTNTIEWGIGYTTTRRLFDQYAQRELMRDQGNVGFYDAYASGLETTDALLSKEDTSVATAFNSLFSSMQSAVQNTTAMANRRELLTNFQNLVDRYHTLNYNINNEINDTNKKAQDTVTSINDLVQGIYNINRQVRGMGPNTTNSEMGLQLMDKRDQMINELSQYLDISITTESDGTMNLYLGNGQLLLNGDTYATLNIKQDPLDSTRRSVSLIFSNPQAEEISMPNDGWGGKLGGFLMATDELRQSMRELGQSALAFADAMNQQNRAGLTLDGKSGLDLITIPEVKAASTTQGHAMTLNFIEGAGDNIRSTDYKVVFDSNYQPNGLRIFQVDAAGNETEVPDDEFVITDNDPNNPSGGLTITMQGHGITMSFNQNLATLQSEQTQFLAQPTLNAAFNIKTAITKPEDFAFASVIRVEGEQHAGNAIGELVGVFDTQTYGTFVQDPANPDRIILADTAPQRIVYEVDEATNVGSYVVYDGNGNRLGAAQEGPWAGQNIFEHVVWDDPTLNTDENAGYPGYEVSFTGTVKHGSAFSLANNQDGMNDNSNGNLLASLEQEGTVYSTEMVRNTFTQDYADLTAGIGSAVMSATTDFNAAYAKMEQSYNLFYSKAGVNLDEEAANLIRYQQSYSACAKIITASQTIFDALITSF